MNRYALEICKKLSASPDWVSGEEMAKALGTSRVNIARQVAKLKEEGFAIEASPRRGYLLTPRPLFNAYTLQAALDEVKESRIRFRAASAEKMQSQQQELRNSAAGE